MYECKYYTEIEVINHHVYGSIRENILALAKDMNSITSKDVIGELRYRGYKIVKENDQLKIYARILSTCTEIQVCKHAFFHNGEIFLLNFRWNEGEERRYQRIYEATAEDVVSFDDDILDDPKSEEELNKILEDLGYPLHDDVGFSDEEKSFPILPALGLSVLGLIVGAVLYKKNKG